MKNLKTIVIVLESIAIVVLILFMFDYQVLAQENWEEAVRQRDSANVKEIVIRDLQRQNEALRIRADSLIIIIQSFENQ